MKNINIRNIRSFVRREGRMSARQKRALENLWGKYGIDLPPSSSTSRLLPQGENGFILEIGFGMGKSLLEMAKAHPEQDFIGVEVYRSGVGSLLADLEDHKVPNVRVFCEDIINLLEETIGDSSIDRVQIFFPDPWPKKHHHKRRLIQNSFVEKMADKLRPGGIFHAATDNQNYAEHMLAVLSNAPHFINQAGEGQFAKRPDYRPLTKYERRGLALGHGVWDLVFVKQDKI